MEYNNQLSSLATASTIQLQTKRMTIFTSKQPQLLFLVQNLNL